jgi:GTP-binding protein EngB required for normal cell division
VSHVAEPAPQLTARPLDLVDAAELNALVARTAEFASAAGREDLAARLREHSTALDAGALRVVVAGETQRGKSRLVNALVGRPDLSPAGESGATGCHVEMRHADTDYAEVSVASVTEGDRLTIIRQRIGLDEVARYARVGGEDHIAGIVIGLPVPLLAGLTLVDTPGLSGLDPGRRRMTLTALDRADALLFVCDCSQPLLAPELEFLRHAADRVTAVVVAATKTDRYPAYEQVVAETRARLCAAPELRAVPVIAVSASTAELASRVENRARAALLQDYAGTHTLVTTLVARTAQQATVLRLANLLQLLRGTIRTLHTAESAGPAGQADNPERLATLIREYEQLRVRLGDEQSIRMGAQHHIQRMKVRPRHAFDERAAELRRQYREETQSGSADDLETLPSRLEADLAAAVHEALSVLTATVEELDRHLADRLGYTELCTELDGGIGADVPLAVASSHSDSSRTQSLLAMLPGLRIGTLIAGPSTALAGVFGLGVVGALPFVAAGLAAAVAVGWWSLRTTTTRTKRTQLRSWVDLVVNDAKAVFTRVVEDRAMMVQEHVDLTLPPLLKRRVTEINALHAQATALAKADREQRMLARADNERRTAVLAELAERTEALIRQLAAGVAAARSAGHEAATVEGCR